MKYPTLAVYLHQILAGYLNRNVHGEMVFFYDDDYLKNKQNLPISRSLPLQKTHYITRECRPFFSGLLPEADLRVTIARHLGISEKNDFALLAAIGGECAGAISLLSSETKQNNQKPSYRIIDDHAISHILKTLIQKPMLAGEEGVRLSLAGAQDKLAVAIVDGHLAIPIGGAPSTHILKPINKDFTSLIENECFCLQLARNIGLNAVEASIHDADGTPYLLVKRYDRITTEKGIQRLHQEDFCQALGIVPEMKYQREGGPGIRACFQLLRAASSYPVIDIRELLQGILFNLIIGNNDAHGKNFSLIYQAQQTKLAPFYDMISTIHYPNLVTKMAMKIGSKYEFDYLCPRHIFQMAKEINLSVPLVQKELLDVINKIQKHITKSPFSAAILQRAFKLSKNLQEYSDN